MLFMDTLEITAPNDNLKGAVKYLTIAFGLSFSCFFQSFYQNTYRIFAILLE